MKLTNRLTALFTMAVFSLTANAQRIKTVEGNIGELKNETSINFEFQYDSMSVGKFDKESDYIEKKKVEYNTKEAGRGDQWEKNWVSDRKRVFEPKFIELFTKHSKMSDSKTAKYTIILRTKYTEPGFNVGMGVIHKSAKINADAVIVETENKSKVIAIISITDAPGRTFGGYDFDTSLRISECYAVAGKKLGEFIK